MKNSKALPNTLRGSVVAQYRRRGDKVYGPYWARMWREDGKLRKVYVGPDELGETVDACKAERAERCRRIAIERANLHAYANSRKARKRGAQALEAFLVVAMLERKGDRPLTELQARRVERLEGALWT